MNVVMGNLNLKCLAFIFCFTLGFMPLVHTVGNSYLYHQPTLAFYHRHHIF